MFAQLHFYEYEEMFFIWRAITLIYYSRGFKADDLFVHVSRLSNTHQRNL